MKARSPSRASDADGTLLHMAAALTLRGSPTPALPALPPPPPPYTPSSILPPTSAAVSFVQMLKAFCPVTTMVLSFLFGLEKPNSRLIGAVGVITAGEQGTTHAPPPTPGLTPPPPPAFGRGWASHFQPVRSRQQSHQWAAEPPSEPAAGSSAAATAASIGCPEPTWARRCAAAGVVGASIGEGQASTIGLLIMLTSGA